MLRSIGLGNSYFSTSISESEVGVLAELRTFPTSFEWYFLLGNSESNGTQQKPPPIDVHWAVLIVWKIRVKIIRTVQCCIVYHNCTQL